MKVGPKGRQRPREKVNRSNMSLINPAILYGLGFAAVPVILHFLLRAKPKKLVFPALQLIQIRRRQNVRRMRLRHIWLMLLRIALIAFLVVALSRPSLPAADYSLTTGEVVSAIAVLIVALAVYYAVITFWRRRELPAHEIASRRPPLRSGIAIAALVVLLLLVGWPYQRRVSALMRAPAPNSANRLPIAAVFLFDTSLSMSYRQENETRLDVAKQIATEHLEQLPGGSRIAVGDTAAEDSLLFQAELASAQQRINRLTVQPISRPINDRIRAAIALLEEERSRTFDEQSSVPQDARQDRFLREIYVFTDMARTAWTMSAANSLKSQLDQRPWLNVYLLDTSVEEPINLGITSVALSKQTATLGATVTIDADLESVGLDDAERAIEVYVGSDSGHLTKQGQQSTILTGDTASRVQFGINGLTSPITQGELRLVSSDPLAFDDVRYFTIAVNPPPEVLLVAPGRGPRDNAAEALRIALAADELVQRARAPYRVSHVMPEKLAETALGDISIVCLVSVESLPNSAWDKLANFVEGGGGLAVFLGSNPQSTIQSYADTALSYNNESARELLPAELIAAVRFSPAERIDFGSLDHPMLSAFQAADFGGMGELSLVGVHRYWKVKPYPGSQILADFTGPESSAALLERPYGSGRTILLTTSIDMRGWSELPLAGWWFVAWVDQAMQYLARYSDDNRNYEAGEEVFIRVDEEPKPTHYLLSKPRFEQIPGDIPEDESVLLLPDVDQVGQYRLISDDPGSRFRTGFSVNPPAGESSFVRLTDPDLNELFGENRYSTARNIDGLTRIVNFGRIGQEVFPLIVLCALIVFCTEHIVANRFYQADQAVEHSTN